MHLANNMALNAFSHLCAVSKPRATSKKSWLLKGLPVQPLCHDAEPAGLIGLRGGPQGSGLVALGILCTAGPNLEILLLLLVTLIAN